MSQKTTNEVMDELTLKWLFNQSANRPPVNGLCIDNDDQGEYINVMVTRPITPEDKTELPDVYEGVRLKYKVTGRIISL